MEHSHVYIVLVHPIGQPSMNVYATLIESQAEEAKELWLKSHKGKAEVNGMWLTNGVKVQTP